MLYYFVKIYQRCLSLEKTIFKKEFSNTAHTFFQNQNMAKAQEAISKRKQEAKPTSEL